MTSVESQMVLRAYGGVDPIHWDAGVARLGGNVFNTHAWAQYKSRAGRREPVFCEWRSADGAVVGRGVALRTPGTGSWLGRIYSRLDFDTAPCMQEGVDCVPALEAWVMKDRSLSEVRLGSFDATVESAKNEVDAVHRLEFVLSLEPSSDPVERMRKSTRYEVRRAARAGLDVRASSESADVAAFVKLYWETLVRLQRDKGVPLPRESPDELALAITQLIGAGRGRLFLCDHQGGSLGGCLFGTFNGSAYYLLNGSTDSGRALAATHMTLASALRQLSRTGFSRVNLGGVSANASATSAPDHGLYQFKRGFGGEEVDRTTSIWRCRPIRVYAARAARLLLR